ncbi:hypothetical protein GHNINEIG_01122 [Hydrogenovibrio crunogenus]|uniref:Uncharacterized protein n=1 Tax=Hydrogenovibrio crunogenus TaxID=39765 RepID=A0A4P7NZ34_9GAMM|nr:hypothetical protein [Hydrogenovibrio crunogenus]QBZ83081.1 hypothetical protein GHNINEIG_01122 [Hydrogenovibrio crunogenus]
MAVLVEGYSIIINKAQAMKNQEALSALASVEGTLQPMAICSDAGLLRIGFMDLKDANEFVMALESAGLRYNSMENGEEIARDIVMVTQFGEINVTCPWLSVQFTKLKDDTLICVAALQSEEKIDGVAFPKGWAIEVSILKRFYEERTLYMQENYELVREEPMHDIYRNPDNGEEIRLLKLKMVETPKEALQ